jgi:hypothetical protein
MKKMEKNDDLSLTNTMTKNEWHKPEINEIAEISEVEYQASGNISDATGTSAES